eukprot:414536_1
MQNSLRQRLMLTHKLTNIKSILFIILCCIFSMLILLELQKNDNRILNTSYLKYFSSKNAIIVGLVKDASQTLPNILSDLDHFAMYFNMTQFIFFESNSNDNTLQILFNWRHTNKNNTKKQIDILHDDQLIVDTFAVELNELQSMELKEDRYVYYRNMLLEHAKQTHLQNAFFIIIDLDIGSIHSWHRILHEIYDGITSHNSNLICLNGITEKGYKMRDTYATVDINDNWYRSFHYGWYKQSYFKEFLYIIYYPLFNTKRYIDVKSCFGGMAFYYSVELIKQTECKYILFSELQRMSKYNNDLYNSSLIVNNYKRLLKENTTCEHIPFNMCLFNHGFNGAISTQARFKYMNG